jgi:hypothetical protein
VFSGVAAFGGDEASDDRTLIVLRYSALRDHSTSGPVLA